jgi:hypothetical protein
MSESPTCDPNDGEVALRNDFGFVTPETKRMVSGAFQSLSGIVELKTLLGSKRRFSWRNRVMLLPKAFAI